MVLITFPVRLGYKLERASDEFTNCLKYEIRIINFNECRKMEE